MTTDESPPEFISKQDMERIFTGGPLLGKNAVLVVTGGRMYKQTPEGWILLDDKPHSTTKEPTGANVRDGS